MAYNEGYYPKKNYSNKRFSPNARTRVECFLKMKEGKNGSTYMEGYHPLLGKVVVFTWPEGEKGYIGKVGATGNNLNK